jgi:V-type H+-transporting ATPase subunit a
LTQQITAQGITLRPYEETLALLSGRSGPQALEELDSRLAESEQRVQSMNNSYDNLEKRALELEEARQVLRETDIFFNEARNRRGEIRSSFEENDQDTPLLGDVEGNVAASQAAAEVGAGGNYGGFELE